MNLKQNPHSEKASGSGFQAPLSAPRPALWALVDCNTFYCSCERLFRPDLAGKPVAVLSNNDGCLIALSPETKALGFTMGEVYFQVKHRLKALGVTVFSSNYTLYGDISNRVMRTLASLAPIEQYSIDECFVPLYPAAAAQALDVGRAMSDRVQQWVGMPVRVGIGSTRTLAKLANLWAKKRSRVFRLSLGSDELEDILEATPTGDIWGVGRRLSAKLAGAGIYNARQLRDMEPDKALKLLTVTGQRTVLELRGVQCIMEDEAPVPRKTLINTRSFGRRVTARDDLAEALSMHCSIAGARLRQENMEAAGLRVELQTSRHAEEPYYRAGAAVTMPVPTNSTTRLIRAALQALDACYQPGRGYMKGGIMLFDLQEQGTRQLTLTEAVFDPQRQRENALMRTLDAVNGRYGTGALRYAAEGPAKASWHMTRNLLSQSFTTRWAELARVK